MTPEPDISSPVSLPAVEKTQRQDSWLGPLFYWEMLREIRKIRSYLPRVLFALVLLLQMYLSIGSADITQKQAAYFSERNVNHYLLFQYLAVAFLTPVFVCGAIIEERQQGTLSIMLTTYLTTGEWLRGKMMGRLAPMLTLLITGIPVLALMQLFGGVNIFNVVMHSLLAAVLMLAVGMHAIYCSVQEKTVGSAIIATYMLVLGGVFLGYLLVWPLSAIVIIAGGINRFALVILLGGCIVLFQLLLGWRSLRKAIGLLQQRQLDYDPTKSQAEQMDLETRLASFETRLTEAIRNQSATQKSDSREARARDEIELFLKNRKRKSYHFHDWPVLWKGCLSPSTTAVQSTIVIVYFIHVVIFASYVLTAADQSTVDFFQHVYWMAKCTMLLTLFLITLRAGSILVTERTEQTLLPLLILPWSPQRLTAEFAAGCFWRYRWLLLLSILTLLFPALLLKPWGTIFLLTIYCTQLVFFGMLGLFISSWSRTIFFARMLVVIIMIVTLLILPEVIRQLDWHALYYLLPYRSWSMLEPYQAVSDFFVLPIVGLVIQWLLSAYFFASVCHRLTKLPRGS